MTDEAATGENQTAASANNGEQNNVAAQNTAAANSENPTVAGADTPTKYPENLTAGSAEAQTGSSSTENPSDAGASVTSAPSANAAPVVPDPNASGSGDAGASAGATDPKAADSTASAGTPKESVVAKVEGFLEGIVSYLKSELKEGEELVGQYFQLHFRKHANGDHTVTLQPSGRAADMKEFTVKSEVSNG